MSKLKESMKLPPIPQPPSRDRSNRRKDRVRLEIGQVRARWLLTVLQRELKEMEIDSDEFADVHHVYSGLRLQVAKAEKATSKS